MTKPSSGWGVLIALLVLEVLVLGLLIYGVLQYGTLSKEIFVDPTILQGLVVFCFVGYVMVLAVRERRTAARVIVEKVKTVQVVESMPMGLVILDGDGAILSINERACAALTADPVMCLNRPLAGWLDEEAGKKLAGNFTGKLDAKAAKSGGRLRLGVMPLHGAPGKVVTLEDPDRTMRIIRQAPAGMAAFPKARPMFDRLWTELASMLPAEGAAPEPLARALVMARRLRSFTETLGSAPPALDRRPGDLGELARAAASRLDPIRRAKGIHLEIACSGDVAGSFDPELLGAAVEEILLNALSYARPGGVVSVHVGGDARDLSLIVRDDGMGMEETEVRRAWDPEYTGSRQLPETAGARGLGLTLARKIIEAHGTAPLLESMPDAGTRVTVAIPKRAPEP